MVRWPWMLLLAVAVAVLGRTSSNAPQPATDSVELRIRDTSAEFPKECSPQDVLQLVAGFVEAFNQGEPARLGRYFGEGFQWYSAGTGPDDGKTIDQLADLQPYFAERHRHAEKLTLQALEVSAGGWHGGIDIVFNVQRSADDLKQGAVNGGGKGMVRCMNQSIAVWSWGSEPSLRQELPN